MTSERAAHWRDTYTQRGDAEVSWFSIEPTCSIALIDAGGADPGRPAVDVGAGASRLADVLLERGFVDVTVLDVSDDGLAHTRERLGADASRLRCVVSDVLDWVPDHRFGLWHDRAVFHFLTDAADRQRYRDLLDSALTPDALVVVGTFAADGPESCSGLPTARYSPEALAAELGAGPGSGLRVVAQRREEHRTPWGAVQPFTWLALRRE
ncbi:class I SAM-dependent methyltransferase [Pseudonocardia sp. KRD-169]|uniref:Class I SAM-dependent methyltransferase n=2 Tax=Pseudonocardia abyssalis TaxID=2792008 RepID=A0ABS6UYE1_9PSEU|nr:class I SAM-dependent methyltransferase [Pseudonocardia abyssalis]MBW0137268.1 class I SAM-dependent methyltransferase [Pseudonocardia abyssalis]